MIRHWRQVAWENVKRTSVEDWFIIMLAILMVALILYGQDQIEILIGEEF